MKNKYKILTAFIVLFISLAIVSSNNVYASLKMKNLEINAIVNDDASMEVTEKWTIRISETNTLFKSFKKDSKKYSSIENVTVKKLTNKNASNFYILNYNAIKYKNKENAYIQINTNLKGEQVFLIIEDNGMGISSSDLPKVFEKSFTGKNGRIMTKSTGMGLYIASSLCKKLGHKIQIDSKEGIYTKVTLTFSLHSFYDVVK